MRPWKLAAGSGAILVALLLVACGGGASEKTGHQLRLAISDDSAPPDPHTYYASSLLAVTKGAYEGLVEYASGTTDLKPALATSWKQSPDGLTYTFSLRRGVRFSDGTPLDSEAVKKSFQRFIDIKGGPSYQLAAVKSMSTPDPHTFVVHLKSPYSPFLDALASPWGVTVISPTALAKHAVGNDRAAKWLATHTAGTGPYTLARVKRGSQWVLEANPRYWGDQPYFTTLNLAVQTNSTTQTVQLEGGTVDMLGTTDVQLNGRQLVDLKKKSCCDVHTFPSLTKSLIWINPASKVFGRKDARTALATGLNLPEMASEAYGPAGAKSTTFYPKGILPAALNPDDPTYDPSALERGLAPDKGRSVVIGHCSCDQPSGQLANLLQVRLQAVGLKATISSFTSAVYAEMSTKPNLRPDIVIAPSVPDAASPDLWASVYLVCKSPLNAHQVCIPEADKLEAAGVRAPNPEAAERLFGQAASMWTDSKYWINIADVQIGVAVRKGITGLQVDGVGLLDYAALRAR